MSDLIDREILIRNIENLYQSDWNFIKRYLNICEVIEDIPSVKQVEDDTTELKEKVGCWICDAYCSECNYLVRDDFNHIKDYQYCPNCGAYMKGRKNE